LSRWGSFDGYDEHYVLNGEKYLVSFEYMGQNIPTVSVDCGKFVNVLKRGNVNGLKIDEETKSPLANAVFGLFKVTETKYSADTAIMTATSDENGCFSFANIPYGDYVVKEIAAPAGYVLSYKIYPVTVSENGQVVEITAENTKIRGNVSVTKIDAEYPDNKLTGAEFTVYSDKECRYEIGKLGETKKGIYTINNIAYGKYYLKETVAPIGYVIEKNIYEFEIVNDGETVAVSNTKAGIGFENSPITGTVEITKSDVSDGKLIPNCGIEILDKNKNVIFQGRTDKNGVVKFENLRYGEYFYREFDAPKGYILDETAYPFSIKENGEIVKCQMTNTKVPVVPDTPVTPKPPVIPDTPSSSSPKTGDDSNVSIWLITVCMALTISMVTLYPSNEPHLDSIRQTNPTLTKVTAIRIDSSR